jgi:hypothetical protein
MGLNINSLIFKYLIPTKQKKPLGGGQKDRH